MTIQPYQLEPEYSSSKEAEAEPVDSGEEEVSQVQSPSIASRWTDCSWCVCERCTVMTSKVERGSQFGKFLIKSLYRTLSILSSDKILIAVEL